MVYVVVFAVVVCVASLAVVGMLAWRTLKQVKSLGRTVAAASERIAEASAGLEGIDPANRR